MRCCARRNAARSRTSAITNGAPQLARQGGCRRTSISDGSSEHACAIIATSKSRMIRNCWGAARDAPATRPSTVSIVIRTKSGYLLEDHVPAIERDAANPVLMRQDERRADVGMTRKRHLGARRKNPDTSGVCKIGRRQHESRLGKIELVGDGLHLSVGKTACIGNDRHRVAAELPIGEDIDRLKWHFHKRPWISGRPLHRTCAPSSRPTVRDEQFRLHSVERCAVFQVTSPRWRRVGLRLKRPVLAPPVPSPEERLLCASARSQGRS